MKTNKIKYLLGLTVIVLATQNAVAQPVSRSSYFMDNSTHKHLLNPALTPVRGYFSIPALGAFDLNLETNLGLNTFLFEANDASNGELRTFLHPTVSADDFLSKLNSNNYINLNQRASLVSLGFYAGRSFWTFDVAERINLGVNLPKDLFAFMKQGMSSSNTEYNIDNLSVNMDLIAETSLGTSFMIGKKLRVGAKGKFLAGGAKIKAGIESMNMKLTTSSWDINTTGLMEVYGAGLEMNKDENGVILFESPNYTFPGPMEAMAGMGYAFDLGFNWSPLKFLNISAGVIDLGGNIKWNKDNIMVAKSNSSVSYTGIEGLAISENEDGTDPMGDYIDNLTSDLMKIAEFKEEGSASEDVIEKLPMTVNAGLELTMLKNHASIGVLYSRQFREIEPWEEITGSLNLRPTRWFNLTASYSHYHGNMESFGFAFGFVPLLANIYIAADYVPLKVTPQYIPVNMPTTNIHIGASFPLGRMKVKKEKED